MTQRNSGIAKKCTCHQCTLLHILEPMTCAVSRVYATVKLLVLAVSKDNSIGQVFNNASIKLETTSCSKLYIKSTVQGTAEVTPLSNSTDALFILPIATMTCHLLLQFAKSNKSATSAEQALKLIARTTALNRPTLPLPHAAGHPPSQSQGLQGLSTAAAASGAILHTGCERHHCCHSL